MKAALHNEFGEHAARDALLNYDELMLSEAIGPPDGLTLAQFNEQLPTWNTDDGSIDMYYWYYGSLALFQVGGESWRKWNKAMVPAIVKSQHPLNSGRRTGSWDPVGPWGHDGGRVYSTAVQVMCLEVYYRYGRVFGLHGK